MIVSLKKCIEINLRMKKLIILFVCVLFCSCNKNTTGQRIEIDPEKPEIQNDIFLSDLGLFCCKCSESTIPELSWDYPIKPGMEEWKNFHSYAEMVNACQIPEDILVSLSTEELLQICLGYPLPNVLSFNRYNDGLDLMSNDYNGVKELFNREDLSKELLSWYDCQIKNLTIWNKEGFGTQKGLVSIKIVIFETLLSRVSSDYKNVLQSLVTGYEEKLKYPEVTLMSNINFSARAHIIQKMCVQCLEEISEKERKSLLDASSSVISDHTMDIINKLSYQLTK